MTGNRQLAVYYWTGTGNTARAVGLVGRVLQESGWAVRLTKVALDTPVPSAEDLAGKDLVLVACPTLGFSAPASFLAWLKRWPKVTGGRSAVLAVCGSELWRGKLIDGHSGGLRRQVARVLNRKRLPMAAATDLSYPANWTQVMPPSTGSARNELLARGDDQALAFAAALSAGTPAADRRSRWVSLPLSVVGVLFRTLARRFLARLYAADPSCNSCGLCARQCPAGAILLQEGLPRWNLGCDGCNRCINLCPQASIQTTWFRLGVHGALQLGLTGGAVAGLWFWGPVLPWVLWLGLTAAELTWLDSGLVRLERRAGLRFLLTRGPTHRWGRYRAPDF